MRATLRARVAVGTLVGLLAVVVLAVGAPGTLSAAGDVDPTIGQPGNYTRSVTSMALQPDGKVLIGGDFEEFNGTYRNHVARLNADGSLDTAFFPYGLTNYVAALALQPDGKVLIGGAFTLVYSQLRNGIARLNADGSLDTTFAPPGGANGVVWDVNLQPDGKVLIGGEFTQFNGQLRNRIARLNADGSLDTTFDPGAGVDGSVGAVALQPDGKVLIGGFFSSVDSRPRFAIARLNADGSLDTTFATGGGASNSVYAVAPQPDGKVLVGGTFTQFNGTPRAHIVRLNADGSLDTAFDVRTGAIGALFAITLQPDGKVLIGGNFSEVNSQLRNGIARLNADGSLDTTFDVRTGVDGSVRAVTLQPDGKVLISGYFSEVNSQPRKRIARLNADGSLDTTFEPTNETRVFVPQVPNAPRSVPTTTATP